MNASEVGAGGPQLQTERTLAVGGGSGGSAGAAARSGDTFDHDPSRFKGAQEPRLGAERPDEAREITRRTRLRPSDAHGEQRGRCACERVIRRRPGGERPRDNCLSASSVFS